MPIPPDAEEKSRAAYEALRDAVAEAIERKRRLGQYWVTWDGEKPIKMTADGPMPFEGRYGE